ncbi:MAG: hypothetical protein Ct9H300mP19_07740 [Dehalococcoidia bacterium]|nr:MAG: hypothetical protein Ct9H300mP19_07740 [Dehalococcoidia bacterium]
MAVSLTQSNVGFSGVVIGAIGAVMNNAMRWPETLNPGLSIQFTRECGLCTICPRLSFPKKWENFGLDWIKWRQTDSYWFGSIFNQCN